MSEDEGDDWAARWRRLMPFGPWTFPDINEMMREMEKEFMQFKDIEKQVPKDLVRERTAADGSVRKEIGPIVYGYSMTIGPDGKPVIREFGNVKRSSEPLKGITDKREPLVDVVDGDKQVRIIAEIPGVGKDDIEIRVEDRNLTIAVDTPHRKYEKRLQLPETAILDGAKSSYNNGILEITFPKRSGTASGVRLKVE